MWKLALAIVSVAIGVLGTLLIQQNATYLTLKLASIGLHAPPWLTIGGAFAVGVIAAILVAGLAGLGGLWHKIIIGTCFVFALCLAAIMFDLRGWNRVALLIGLALLLSVAAWDLRSPLSAGGNRIAAGARSAWTATVSAFSKVLSQLAAWVHGLARTPPVITELPGVAVALLIVFVLASVLIGSTILVRAALIVALAWCGLVAALRATALVLSGQRIEIRPYAGGLGGGNSGWRFSEPGSLLLIAAILLGAAVGLAQVERASSAPPTISKPLPQTVTGREPGVSGREGPEQTVIARPN